MDLQIREHKLRWYEFPTLKKMLTANHFEILATYSGPQKEKFSEDEHVNIWLVTVAK